MNVVYSSGVSKLYAVLFLYLVLCKKLVEIYITYPFVVIHKSFLGILNFFVFFQQLVLSVESGHCIQVNVVVSNVRVSFTFAVPQSKLQCEARNSVLNKC